MNHQSDLGGAMEGQVQQRILIVDNDERVLRVIENLLVYRVRFESGASVLTKSDQRPGNSHEANSAPALLVPASAALEDLVP